MKLICLTGTHANVAYPLVPPGLSLGREADNDIALDDGEASRYHAKIQYNGGVWYVQDNGSTNGVYLNGKRIEGSSPLSLKDTIRIGTTSFSVVEDTASPTPDPQGAAAPGSAGETSAPTRRKSRLPGILVAVLVGILIAIVIAVLLAPPTSTEAKGPGEVDVSSQPLAIFYEHVLASHDKIFRYELVLSDGELRITIDDAVNRTRVEDSEVLDKTQLELLRNSLLTDEFLKAEPRYVEQRTDGIERDRILIRTGPIGNYVVVENAPKPPVIEDTLSRLTQFVQAEFGIFADTMPREEIVAKARDFFEQGRRLQADASVESSNLYRALVAYRHVLERLKWLDDKPDFYEVAVTQHAQIKKEIEGQLSNLEREAITFRKTGQLQEARARYMSIVNTYPDRDNEYVRRARKEILNLDDELKKLRRVR